MTSASTLRPLGRPQARSDPPRERMGQAVSLLLISCLALSGPLHEHMGLIPLVVAALGLCAGIFLRSGVAVHVGLVTTLMAVLTWSIGQYWPATSVALLIIYGVLVRKTPFLRESCAFWERGRAHKSDVLLALAFIVTSGVSLVIWSQLTTADLTSFSKFVPDFPRTVILSGLVFYACLNALYEEVIWRGVVTQALERRFGNVWTALVLQSVAFGLWHFVGFPSGWIGVGLAGIFAFMMGLLRLRTKGLLTPFVAHVAADVTIYVIVAVFVL